MARALDFKILSFCVRGHGICFQVCFIDLLGFYVVRMSTRLCPSGVGIEIKKTKTKKNMSSFLVLYSYLA